MIHLYADGREVALPSDLSFQYNVENPFVTEAEGYSMSIDVPLTAGDNIEIFGMILRLDVDIDKIRYDALLMTPQYTASGVLAVVGVSETSVKLQFLQGRSAQNFNAKLDETYINELDLGGPALSYRSQDVAPSDTLASIDSGAVAVTLPWILASSGEIVHNQMRKNTTLNRLEWHPDTRFISYMPYLLVVAKRICTAAGYTYDFSQWESSVMRYLIVCNVMPESLKMYNFSYPLPHWSISEFFENIGSVLHGRFTIDTAARHVSFSTDSAILSASGKVHLSEVVDEFSVTLDTDPDKEQRPEFLRNRGYDDNSGRFWPVRCCDWYIRNILNGVVETENSGSSGASGSDHVNVGDRVNRPNPGWYYDTMLDQNETYKTIRNFDTLAELIQYAYQFKFSTNLPGFGGDALFYAADCRSFFALQSVRIIEWSDIPQDYRTQFSLPQAGLYYFNALYPVNDFGDYILDNSDDADRVDLKVVPVDIDVADGLCCFLPFSEAGDPVDDSEVRQPKSFSIIMSGKQERPQYYDKLYVGFWNGLRPAYWEAGIYPLTSNVTIYTGWKYEFSPEGMDLRLNNGYVYGSDEIIGIDFHKLYKISFLSDSIPEVSAVFLIRGKRYICKKLSVDFQSSGMSSLIKGEFYRLD